MKLRFSILIVMILLTACAPKATPPAVDVVGTRAVELAVVMLTQTVAAYSPTPSPLPTLTSTPVFTETPSITATPAATTMPKVVGPAPCYTGPGPSYELTSNISDFKDVEMIGVGSVPGWYVIKNPYFYSACWIAAENLKLEVDFNLSAYPTITP